MGRRCWLERTRNDSKRQRSKKSRARRQPQLNWMTRFHLIPQSLRSEEHTSELQSRQYLVCRLLLEKKNQSPQTLRREAPVDVLIVRVHIARPVNLDRTRAGGQTRAVGLEHDLVARGQYTRERT